MIFRSFWINLSTANELTEYLLFATGGSDISMPQALNDYPVDSGVADVYRVDGGENWSHLQRTRCEQYIARSGDKYLNRQKQE